MNFSGHPHVTVSVTDMGCGGYAGQITVNVHTFEHPYAARTQQEVASMLRAVDMEEATTHARATARRSLLQGLEATTQMLASDTEQTAFATATELATAIKTAAGRANMQAKLGTVVGIAYRASRPVTRASAAASAEAVMAKNAASQVLAAVAEKGGRAPNASEAAQPASTLPTKGGDLPAGAKSLNRDLLPGAVSAAKEAAKATAEARTAQQNYQSLLRESRKNPSDVGEKTSRDALEAQRRTSRLARDDSLAAKGVCAKAGTTRQEVSRMVKDHMQSLQGSASAERDTGATMAKGGANTAPREGKSSEAHDDTRHRGNALNCPRSPASDDDGTS